MTKISVVFLAIALTGCVTIPPDRYPIDTEKRAFIYDFVLPGKSKAELFKSAKYYMATAYGDVRAVNRLEDEDGATIIGRALMPWKLTVDSLMIPTIPCKSNYNIIFIAKEGKARLQLELQPGAANPGTCGWELPPKRDYAQFPIYFEKVASEFSQALHSQAPIDKLNDF